MKTCTGCKQDKPATEFFRDKRTENGLMARCKKCKMQSYRAAGQASVEGGPEGADPTYASAEADSFKRCADELEAALLTPAR